MTANECELVVDGKAWYGWTRVEIQRSLEQLASGFSLELTTRWPGVEIPVGLREGLACEVRLGGETVITGYIDQYEPDMSETSSILRIEGRDRTGDLVDCSAIHKSGQWRSARLETIVRDIAAPFGIKVAVATDTGDVFKSFSLEDGEQAFDTIDRACRLRGVLATSTVDGHLVLTRAGSKVVPVRLQEGVNIKRMKAAHSWKDRHSEIFVKAQVPGDDDEFGEQAAHLKASAKDAEINRYRPLIVMAEHGTSAKSLADRAKWETLVRMGRGKRGSGTVVGWRMGRDGMEGDLWKPNTLVHITSQRMNLEQEMLIVGCRYTLDDQGTMTELEFTRREAFDLQGAPGHRRKKDKNGDGFVASWELDAPRGAE